MMSVSCARPNLLHLLLALCISAGYMPSALGASKTPFFKVSASLASENTVLLGEDIQIDVVVTNPNDIPLSYLPRGSLLVGLDFEVFRDDTKVARDSRQPLFGSSRRHKNAVRQLRKGRTLRGRISLGKVYRTLPVGSYRVEINLIQEDPPFDLAAGKAAPVVINFKVKNWQVKEIMRREVDGWTAALIRTKESKLLVAWHYTRVDWEPRAKTPWDRVVVVTQKRDVPLSKLLWWAGPSECHIVELNNQREKGRLITIHRARSKIEVWQLDRGEKPGRPNSEDKLLKRADVKPESADERSRDRD